MEIHPIFNDTIGQAPIKAALSMFAKSYQREKRLPFIMFNTARGCGKTHFARLLNGALEDDFGDCPTLTERNAAEITVKSWFEVISPEWVAHGGTLFIDECHNLCPKLMQLFLTLLNTDKTLVRELNYQGIPYSYDFSHLNIILATTDQQKLPIALRDRLIALNFSEYSDEELWEIFKLNLHEEIIILPETEKHIVSCFRGHPRDVVKMAQSLRSFCASSSYSVNVESWKTFRYIMQMFPFGLNRSEITLLQKLSENGSSSLQTLSSMTGFDTGVIRQDYEIQPIKKGLMKIDGQRILTPKGFKYLAAVAEAGLI